MHLKKRREALGLTLADLSRMTGLHIVTLSRLEHGKISIGKITLEHAIKLADALLVDLRELL